MSNTPPSGGICLPAATLQKFVAELFQKAGTNKPDAALIAELLTATDLRGVHSHVTRASGDTIAAVRRSERIECASMGTAPEP